MADDDRTMDAVGALADVMAELVVGEETTHAVGASVDLTANHVIGFSKPQRTKVVPKTVTQISLSDGTNSHSFSTSGCVVYRDTGGGPEVLTVTARWSREFMELMLRLQEPRDAQTLIDTCEKLLQKLTTSELKLVSGATSFWQIAHCRIVDTTDTSSISVCKIREHDADTEVGWTDRRGRVDIPHAWLKDSPTMNGNIAEVNFSTCGIPHRAGEEFARRRRPRDITHEAFPRGEVDVLLDENELAAALRELKEEAMIPAADVEIVRDLEKIGDTHWVVCRLRPGGHYDKETTWFTGVQNCATTCAAWRPWTVVRAERWVAKDLREMIDDVLQFSEVGQGPRVRVNTSIRGGRAGSRPARHSLSRVDVENGDAAAAGVPSQCRNASKGKPCARDPCPFSHDDFPPVPRSEATDASKSQCRNAANGKPCARIPCPFSHEEFPAAPSRPHSGSREVDPSAQCRNAANGKPCARDPCPFSHDEHPAVPR